MDKTNQLTLEQEFKLAIYRQKVYKLNNKLLKKHVIATLKQMIIKDNMIKFFIKNSMS
uniref:Uncharacterized protein ycf18 n=2 Tax=Gracilariopsis TaxID=2781 RepID=A0A1C9CF09_9FLOR|nr:phycobilisome degradation protein [Gracilariopsis lemaneiformis]YP_009294674.1 phycobilisome degradation protein [Gracilariopsis chorda]AJO68504.1 phycobilisome degradation protein [Gracilariopsis lemaneiformis]AML79813.1 phycobilisome degradation protein [Gracilariopsis lemaneiformis]AOM66934.1 phycobilisome degradation protein [Gracilariopsis chorda]UAD88804.1 phycobilisome degradation protein [Gracilariopsis chorda]